MPKKLSQEEFIEKCKGSHGNRYDYSLVKYINAKNKIKIICSEHGEFEQVAYQHSIGRGCSKCGGSEKLSVEEFVLEAKKIHGDKYDYSLVNYINNKERVEIICPTHGSFLTIPVKHLKRNFGCPRCGIEKRSDLRRNDINDIINRFTEIHGDKYDYSKFEYNNYSTPSIIICSKHGEFLQNTYNHLKGCGCPSCGNLISNKEVELRTFIEDLGFEVSSNSRKIIPPMELDIFISSLNLAIEYNGLFWHSEQMLEKRGSIGKKYHLNKLKVCEEKGIRLIQIFEDEWNFKKEIVKSRIKHILGIYERKIGGRQIKIKEIDPKEKNLFLEAYHIQGSDKAGIKLGAFYEDELISVMTFGKPRVAMGQKNIKENTYELLRFATKFGVLGQGIASKMLSHFVKNYSPKQIITYSDKRWNTGNLYKQLGFNFIHISSPNYFYIIKDKRVHRFNFRKQELPKKLNFFDASLTEYENMLNNGIDRIWDCGNDKWMINL